MASPERKKYKDRCWLKTNTKIYVAKNGSNLTQFWELFGILGDNALIVEHTGVTARQRVATLERVVKYNEEAFKRVGTIFHSIKFQ